MTYGTLSIVVSNNQNKPFPSCRAGNWDFTYTSQPTYVHGKFESHLTHPPIQNLYKNHHPINFCNLGFVKSYEHACHTVAMR